MKSFLFAILVLGVAPLAAQPSRVMPPDIFKMTAAKVAVTSDGVSHFTGGTSRERTRGVQEARTGKVTSVV